MDLNSVVSFIVMNLNSIATLIMAIATLALAYFSWKSIRQSEKQIKNSKIQTDLFFSHSNNPIFKLLNVHSMVTN
jgi:protein-S-isoprenylcysteine O-methyltransferase Ste14